jgi:hypothetical protein
VSVTFLGARFGATKWHGSRREGDSERERESVNIVIMWRLTKRKKLGGVLRGSMCGQRGEGGGGGEEDQQPPPRDDGSHYSLTAGILPPLGITAFTTRRLKLRPFIVSPFDPRYRFIPFLSF